MAALAVQDQLHRAKGAGSAVVISADGLLVTSAHVVQGSTRGTAAFTTGDEAAFEVVGADRLSDLAVLRVVGSGYQPARLGDASRLRVGQLVVAIGNPLGFEGSVSAGVVSALGRSLVASAGPGDRLLGDVIQTDAALHPGNSGGALANSAAEVIGINTALVGPMVGQGLGMAVPVNETTLAVIGTLAAGRTVRRAYLGIGGGPRLLQQQVASATGFARGVEVVSVVTSSPAGEAGIKPRDVIVSLGATTGRGRPSAPGNAHRQLHRPGRRDRVHTGRAPGNLRGHLRGIALLLGPWGPHRACSPQGATTAASVLSTSWLFGAKGRSATCRMGQRGRFGHFGLAAAPAGALHRGEDHARHDARSGTSSPRATADLATGGSELAHEEGLATALSAFLSQLHYVPSSGPALYAPDPGPAAVQALRANRLPSLVARDTVASTGGAQTGDLAHRLPDVSVVTEATEAEPCQERTSEMLPSRPRLPASGTGGPRPGTIARVPRSDAWARPEPDIQAEAATRPTTAAARLAAIVTSPTCSSTPHDHRRTAIRGCS